MKIYPLALEGNVTIGDFTLSQNLASNHITKSYSVYSILEYNTL